MGHIRRLSGERANLQARVIGDGALSLDPGDQRGVGRA